MPRTASPSNCHKPSVYTIGDDIWYLRHGKWREGKVTKAAGTSDGAKRWHITEVTESGDVWENTAPEDDMRKQGAA
ncbi:hypothetical protein MMC28_011658 [Mycoblastus sanguinarius]|nr:hypothetical protein [Mycoblastus sanguinarius]